MARTKRCYSSYDSLAHEWVYAEPEFDGYARERRMFCRQGDSYDDGAIYSYGTHFMIARKVKDKNGKRVFLINSNTYSSTTTTHQGAVKRAIPDSEKAIEVPDCSVNHAFNIRYYFRQLEAKVDQASKAWKKNKPYYLSEALQYKKQIIDYMATFITEYKFTKAEKAIMAGETIPDDVADQIIKAKTERFKAEALAKKKADKVAWAKEQKRLENWINGVDGSYYSSRYNEKTYLRVSKDGLYIETSHHAEMRIEDALRLYKLIKSNTLRLSFDKYTTKLGETELVIGCHHIGFDEIDRIAKIMGWEA